MRTVAVRYAPSCSLPRDGADGHLETAAAGDCSGEIIR